MSLVLTIRVKIGNNALINSHDAASCLEGIAQRFRASGYVEIVQDNPGEQITRGVINGRGETVGEFTLLESPV